MSVYYEVVVEATCCGRPRPLSKVICTIWTIAGELWGTYRCSEREECIAAELEEVRTQGAPLLKRLEN